MSTPAITCRDCGGSAARVVLGAALCLTGCNHASVRFSARKYRVRLGVTEWVMIHTDCVPRGEYGWWLSTVDVRAIEDDAQRWFEREFVGALRPGWTNSRDVHRDSPDPAGGLVMFTEVA